MGEDKGEFLVLLQTFGYSARGRDDGFEVADLELFVDAIEVDESQAKEDGREDDDQYHQKGPLHSLSVSRRVV